MPAPSTEVRIARLEKFMIAALPSVVQKLPFDSAKEEIAERVVNIAISATLGLELAAATIDDNLNKALRNMGVTD